MTKSPGGDEPRSEQLQPRGHETAERRSLEYHRLIAKRLDKEGVIEARERVETLLAEGHMHARYAEAWRRVLSRPVPEIAEVITADDERGRDLRQNSPVVGLLSERERREIIDAVR